MTLVRQSLAIPDIVVVSGSVMKDERGEFRETYRRSALASFGLDHDFVQDNHSFSRRGVVRGLHYQLAPAGQGKLVAVLTGEVFDVALDIRPDSRTFGKWVSARLSAHLNQMIWIPAGFAHGFCVCSDEALIMYKLTEEFDPETYSGIRWDDPALGIEWPVRDPIVSARDRHLPLLSDSGIAARRSFG